MTVENLQMFADKPDIVDKPSTLYHYTSEKGLAGILDTGTLNPSLKANNPKDARYGNGQYFTDIAPGSKSKRSIISRVLCYTMEIQANFSLS